MSDFVLVMRKAVLPEDEGNPELIMRTTRAAAEEWIENRVGQFFGPSDYYIVDYIPK